MILHARVLKKVLWKMNSVAEILGVAPAADRERFVAVLKCNGACTVRPRVYEYDGAESCAVMDAVGVGRSGCAYGCLGCGDCVGARTPCVGGMQQS